MRACGRPSPLGRRLRNQTTPAVPRSLRREGRTGPVVRCAPRTALPARPLRPALLLARAPLARTPPCGALCSPHSQFPRTRPSATTTGCTAPRPERRDPVIDAATLLAQPPVVPRAIRVPSDLTAQPAVVRTRQVGARSPRLQLPVVRRGGGVAVCAALQGRDRCAAGPPAVRRAGAKGARCAGRHWRHGTSDHPGRLEREPPAPARTPRRARSTA